MQMELRGFSGGACQNIGQSRDSAYDLNFPQEDQEKDADLSNDQSMFIDDQAHAPRSKPSSSNIGSNQLGTVYLYRNWTASSYVPHPQTKSNRGFVEWEQNSRYGPQDSRNSNRYSYQSRHPSHNFGKDTEDRRRKDYHNHYNQYRRRDDHYKNSYRDQLYCFPNHESQLAAGRIQHQRPYYYKSKQYQVNQYQARHNFVRQAVVSEDQHAGQQHEIIQGQLTPQQQPLQSTSLSDSQCSQYQNPQCQQNSHSILEPEINWQSHLIPSHSPHEAMQQEPLFPTSLTEAEAIRPEDYGNSSDKEQFIINQPTLTSCESSPKITPIELPQQSEISSNTEKEQLPCVQQEYQSPPKGQAEQKESKNEEQVPANPMEQKFQKQAFGAHLNSDQCVSRSRPQMGGSDENAKQQEVENSDEVTIKVQQVGGQQQSSTMKNPVQVDLKDSQIQNNGLIETNSEVQSINKLEIEGRGYDHRYLNSIDIINSPNPSRIQKCRNYDEKNSPHNSSILQKIQKERFETPSIQSSLTKQVPKQVQHRDRSEPIDEKAAKNQYPNFLQKSGISEETTEKLITGKYQKKDQKMTKTKRSIQKHPIPVVGPQRELSVEKSFLKTKEVVESQIGLSLIKQERERMGSGRKEEIKCKRKVVEVEDVYLDVNVEDISEIIIHSFLVGEDKIKTKGFENCSDLSIFQRKYKLPTGCAKFSIIGWRFCRVPARTNIRIKTVTAKCNNCQKRCDEDVVLDNFTKKCLCDKILFFDVKLVRKQCTDQDYAR